MGTNLITLKQGLMLLPAETNFFLEKQNCKKDTFIVLGPSRFKNSLCIINKGKIILCGSF